MVTMMLMNTMIKHREIRGNVFNLIFKLFHVDIESGLAMSVSQFFSRDVLASAETP